MVASDDSMTSKLNWDAARPGSLNQGLATSRIIASNSFSHSVQLSSHVRLFVIPWTAAWQASLPVTNSWSLLKLMSIKLVIPSNQLTRHWLFFPFLIRIGYLHNTEIINDVFSNLSIWKFSQQQRRHGLSPKPGSAVWPVYIFFNLLNFEKLFPPKVFNIRNHMFSKLWQFSSLFNS